MTVSSASPKRDPAIVAPETPAEPPELVIEPARGFVAIDWRELYRYRELLYFMIWRDLTVRYKQTVLGVAWAVLQPTFNMIIFTIIFGKLAKMGSEGFPYPLYAYAALLPWTFFSSGVSTAGLSLVNQQHLLTKVYFPRLFIPTNAIGTCLVDFCISCVVFLGLFAWFRTWPSWECIFVLPLLVGVGMATLGLGYLLSALTISFRDLRFIIPFMMQAMMYASPVIYPLSIVPQKYQWLYAINPMAGFIDGFRSATLGKPWNFVTLSVSTCSALLIFVVGLYKFRSTERRFADIA